MTHDPYREPCNIRDVFEGKIVSDLAFVFEQIEEIKKSPREPWRGGGEDDDDSDPAA